MTITLAPETGVRVLAAAARRNEAPEAVVDAALEAYLPDEPAQDEAVREADESEVGKIIAEKFRKQGLNVD